MAIKIHNKFRNDQITCNLFIYTCVINKCTTRYNDPNNSMLYCWLTQVKIETICFHYEAYKISKSTGGSLYNITIFLTKIIKVCNISHSDNI